MKRAGTWLVAAAALATALFVLAATAGAHPVSGRIAPHTFVGGQAPPTTADCQASIGISCYSPNQLQTAYDLKPLYANGLTGKGKTIVLVDSFGSPTIAQDLHQFDSDFGLPDPPSLKVLQPAGAVPPFDGNNDDMVGWAFESTLDVEYAHAMAPGANIVLVETPVSETEGVTGFPEIVKAENFVIDHGIGDVISQSFGATEETFPNKQAIFGLRSAFKNAALHGVTVLGSSGDTGSTDYKLNLIDLYDHQVNSWPSSDPLVTSVGGTQLHLDAVGNRLAPDNVWNDIPIGIDAAGGGGPSHVFPRPVFQLGTPTGSGHARATPDISMTAACSSTCRSRVSTPATTSSAGPARRRRCSRASSPWPTRSRATGSAGSTRGSTPWARTRAEGSSTSRSATTRSRCSTMTAIPSSRCRASRP